MAHATPGSQTDLPTNPQVVVILNPHANWDKAGQMVDKLEQTLGELDAPYLVEMTNEPNHATALAQEAVADGARVVVAAGGDGTVNEVVNGLGRAGEAATGVALGVFPLGTGNDFAEMVGAPLQLEETSQRIARYLRDGSGARQIDMARAQIETRDGQSIERYIDNNMGIGLEARVTVESHRHKNLPDSLVYIVGALRAIIRYDTAPMQIEWRTATGDTHRHDDNTLLVSVGNSPRTGGDFYVTRDAVMDDGLLDLGISAPHLSRFQLIRLMVRALRNQPLSVDAIRIERCQRFTLDCPSGTTIHIDGEVISECVTRIECEVLPGRLLVLADKRT